MTRDLTPYLTRPIVARTIPDGGDPEHFGMECVCEQRHHPEPRYLEGHHVIPRAWQKFYLPVSDDLTPPAREPDSTGVWYPITEPLCRTSHGNVHYWIERAMKMYSVLPPGPDHSQRAMTAAREAQLHIGQHETGLALQALVLFTDYGGNLHDLIDAGLWGGLYGGNDAPT